MTTRAAFAPGPTYCTARAVGAAAAAVESRTEAVAVYHVIPPPNARTESRKSSGLWRRITCSRTTAESPLPVSERNPTRVQTATDGSAGRCSVISRLSTGTGAPLPGEANAEKFSLETPELAGPVADLSPQA